MAGGAGSVAVLAADSATALSVVDAVVGSVPPSAWPCPLSRGSPPPLRPLPPLLPLSPSFPTPPLPPPTSPVSAGSTGFAGSAGCSSGSSRLERGRSNAGLCGVDGRDGLLVLRSLLTPPDILRRNTAWWRAAAPLPLPLRPLCESLRPCECPCEWPCAPPPSMFPGSYSFSFIRL